VIASSRVNIFECSLAETMKIIPASDEFSHPSFRARLLPLGR